MEVLEFLNRTDRRNLKSQIGFQVARKMREWQEDVDRRRWSLSMLLQREALQQDEMIAELLQKQADEMDRRRREWIEMERLKREEAERELVKVKTQQREIENSEAHRHMQSKEILLESKNAQLHQIEEKKALKRRQACVEILWQRVWQRLDESKAQQEQYEQKLRNLVEGRCQAQNLDRDREMKAQFAKEVMADQRECSQALELAAELDILKKQQDLKKAKDKRRQQLTDLQDQIKRNLEIEAKQSQANIREDLGYNVLEDRQIHEELMQKRCARIHNRDWHQRYMAHAAEERAARREQDLRLEQKYLGTGCVLRQKQKQPYGKDVR
ncbi:GRB10-interacting GYF protein 2 [Drosophila ficusphila]|uniref:GRB10-interacting GYF protein 2 n=1 Tax=Drosophila ficusphila TaxID=30025 RepID=UPI0007E65F30|nr:GRB10-interacting GYF protein 2 [Drosophila ficusphila]